MKRIALLVIALSAPPAAAADVAALAAAYANPTLGPAANVVSTTIRISTITIVLTGETAPVLAGDETIGLFFNGKGTYKYQSTNPLENALTTFEAKKLGRSAQGGKGGVTITGNFDRLYLRAAGVELPKLAGSAASDALGRAFRAHLERFARADRTPPSHLLLRQRLDAPSSPVAVAEFSGSDDDVYILDSIEEHSEQLHALATPPTSLSTLPADIRQTLFTFPLSDQPVGRARGKFVQPLFLLVDLDYTLLAGERDAAQLTVTERIVPRGATQSAFRFDLRSVAWDDSGNRRSVKVDDVTDESGKKLPYHFERGSLLVGLPAKMPANTPFLIRFAISGNFLYRLGGGNLWQLGTEPWFPQPGLNGQFYTVHSVVKVKKPWLPFTPGDTVARTEQGELNVVESTLGKPVQFAVAHAGNYRVSEQKRGNMLIRVATYNGANEDAARQLADLAWQCIQFFETFLGPFPFKEFNIIEINDLGWGQAPPATMFMTREAFSPLLGEANRLYSKGINQRFAHEIAHQYWGHVVKMGSFEEQWLTEAFAEYCSSLVVKEIKKEGGYRDLINTWRADAKDAGAIAPIPLANRVIVPWEPAMTSVYRTGLIYSKGAYVLAALHMQLGDEKFFNVLRTIQGRFAWRFLTTNDVEDIIAHFDTGKDYHAFFEQYYWGMEMPALK
jgi:hypothetical protein